jgi:2-polyprenyl-6-methoxyphenol hydroxylase-like FAD-dependent oxidoreductase
VRLKPAAGLLTPGIRIARKDLRRILLDAVTRTGTTVRWGASCVSATRSGSGDGRMSVRILADPTAGQKSDDEAQSQEEVVDDVDLVVAADGASSKLRAALRPHDGLQYAGALQMGGIARYDPAAGLPSPLASSFGGVFVFFSPVSQTEIVWALSVREDVPRLPFNNQDPDQVRQMLDEAKKLGGAIGGVWPDVLARTAPETTLLIPARDKRTFNHDIEGQGNIVFIGDSNHAVSSFAGNGANLALRDSWDLAERLCRSVSLVEGVKSYDKSSMFRALATLKSSHMRIDMGHSTGLKYLGFNGLLTFGGYMLRLSGRS